MLILVTGEQAMSQVLSMSAFIHLLVCKYAVQQISGGTEWVDPSNETWPTACAEGYGGNLCDACVYTDGSMYTRINKHQCLKCSTSQTLNVLRLVGIALCLVVLVGVMIYLNLRSTGTNYLAVLMRMMTNYMQILSFAASFNLGWPQSLKNLYDSISILSQSADQAFSVDCFFSNAGMTDVTQSFPTFFMKAIMLLLLPVMSLAIILLFWGVLSVCWKHYSNEQFTRNASVSIIVVIFLAHPTLTSTAFSMMNCYEIEPGQTWLEADLQIECWDGLHKKFFFTVCLPMLIIWVIGTPVATFILLLKNKSKLNDKVFFGKFRMLYQGLKRKYFYWEIVNTFRKISIVSINVFLSLYPDYIKAIYAMLILAIIFKAQEILKPYEIPVFNWIEQREHIASIVTFYAGLYFVKADVSDAFKYVIITIVFLVNVWFLSIWGYVALTTFKYRWTDYLAKIVKRVICRKLRDSDMLPIDNDGLGMNMSGSQAQKGVGDADFDDIKGKGESIIGPDDKSEILDQSEAPLKNNQDSVREAKMSKKSTKQTKKETESKILASGTSITKGAKQLSTSNKDSDTRNNKNPSSSFSEFSDKILQNKEKTKSKSHKVKEVKEETPKKSKSKKQKTKDLKVSDSDDSSQDDDSNRQAKGQTKTVERMFDKRKQPEEMVSMDQTVENDAHVEDSVDEPRTTHKMPYNQSARQELLDGQTTEKKKKLKVKKVKPSKERPLKDDDSSSFQIDEDRVYTIKKKKRTTTKPKTKKKMAKENEISDDSYSQPPKTRDLL